MNLDNYCSIDLVADERLNDNVIITGGLLNLGLICKVNQLILFKLVEIKDIAVEPLQKLLLLLRWSFLANKLWWNLSILLRLVRIINVIQKAVSQLEAVGPVLLIVPERHVFRKPPHSLGVRVIDFMPRNAENIGLWDPCFDEHHLLFLLHFRPLKTLAHGMLMNLV